jgi:hypothetical protein
VATRAGPREYYDDTALGSHHATEKKYRPSSEGIPFRSQEENRVPGLYTWHVNDFGSHLTEHAIASGTAGSEGLEDYWGCLQG